MLAIKNNIMASNAARHLGKAYDNLAVSVERLASGLRINSAKDDAAGLAVRELIRADIAVLQQGSRNAMDGISMLQTMEGAMGVIDDNLIRMKELAEQAATGSYSLAQRTIMDAEFGEMAAEIDRIAGSTEFNGNNLINNASTVDIHVGTTDTITITGQDMTTSTLGVQSGTSGFEAVAAYGVSLTGDAYLTITDTNDNTDAVTMTIAFSDTDNSTAEEVITVVFSDADSPLSLQDVVDAINAESWNVNLNDTAGNTLNYAMASAEFDTTDSKYHLKVVSQGTTATLVDIDVVAKDATVDVAGMAAIAADFTGGVDLDDTGGTSEFVGATGTGINITTTAFAEAALTAITTAITTKDTARAAFGYKMNRLESTIAILNIQAENLMTAESRVSDVDVATEMATLTRNQVLSQAGVSMLAQANSMPQMALTLLR
ncbi:flagellin [Planctomycetota bacterium]